MYSLLGLIHRLVRDDDGLQRLTGLLNSLEKLGSQESFGDFSTLAHDRVEDGKLGVILGRGKRNIIAVVPQGLDQILVHDSPDEPIESRVGDLGSAGNKRALLTIEGIDRSFDALSRSGYTLEEEGENRLAVADQRVVTLQHRQLDVNESRVLTTRGVDLVLVRGDLLQELVGTSELLSAQLRKTAGLNILQAGRLPARETNAGEFLTQEGRMAFEEAISLAPVCALAPGMQEHDDDDEREDEGLLVEVGGGGALPDAVPLGVGTSSAGRKGSGGSITGAQRGDGGWAGVRGSSKVGEV